MSGICALSVHGALPKSPARRSGLAVSMARNAPRRRPAHVARRPADVGPVGAGRDDEPVVGRRLRVALVAGLVEGAPVLLVPDVGEALEEKQRGRRTACSRRRRSVHAGGWRRPRGTIPAPAGPGVRCESSGQPSRWFTLRTWNSPLPYPPNPVDFSRTGRAFRSGYPFLAGVERSQAAHASQPRSDIRRNKPGHRFPEAVSPPGGWSRS